MPDHHAPMIVERVKRLLAAFERAETDVPAWEQLVTTLRETIGLPLRPKADAQSKPKHKITINPDGTFSAVLADGTPEGTLINCQDKTTLEAFLDQLDNGYRPLGWKQITGR